MRKTALCLSLIATTSSAAQVVVTDVTYTHSAQTTSDSHYMVNPLAGTPANWTSPVNYSQGSAVVRLEVLTKPTAQPTKFQICFEGSPSYACTNQAPTYTTTGVSTWTTSFPSFYQYSSVNWAQGARRIALILKDTNNGKPAPENVGATESAKYMPTQLRVTVTLVSAGSTYVPPEVDAGVPDAGMPQPVDAGAPVIDAGTPVIDAGTPVVDAGIPAEVDAAHPEEVDAGTPAELDAGMATVAPDAGSAEPTLAPTTDPAVPGEYAAATGGCSASPVGVLAVPGLALLRRRRR